MNYCRFIGSFVVLLFGLGSQLLAHAEPLPVLRATSPAVSIRDGSRLRPAFWHLDPKIRPDCYYPDVPRKPHTVVFITDKDSLVVPIHYGQRFDFVIVLNQHDSCYTRIVATEQDLLPYTAAHPHAAAIPDTIPFMLQGSRIYLAGQLNQHLPVRIQLDLGAGMSCLRPQVAQQAGIHWDGHTTLRNSDGVADAPTGHAQRLRIAGLTWAAVPLVQTHNMRSDEDVIVGNSLFQHKVLVIDYDKQHLLLYDTLPHLDARYTRHEVRYEQHRPLVQAVVELGSQRYTYWFLFDTGRDGTMLLHDDFFRQYPAAWHRIRTLLPLGRKHVVVVPRVQLGRQQFTDVVCPAFNPTGPPLGRNSLLGNELLSHYNAVLDNQQGYLYLRPNRLRHQAYESWSTLWPKAAAGGSVLLGGILLGAALIVRGRRTRQLRRD